MNQECTDDIQCSEMTNNTKCSVSSNNTTGVCKCDLHNWAYNGSLCIHQISKFLLMILLYLLFVLVVVTVLICCKSCCSLFWKFLYKFVVEISVVVVLVAVVGKDCGLYREAYLSKCSVSPSLENVIKKVCAYFLRF